MTLAIQDPSLRSFEQNGRDSFERLMAAPAAISGSDREEEAYFRSRASEELRAARRASCAAARDRHDELALLYSYRAAMLASAVGAPIKHLRGAAEAA